MATVYFMRRKLMTVEEDKFHHMDQGELIAELLCITGELGGTMQRLTTLDHSGRTSKKVVIEYNVQQKGEE